MSARTKARKEVLDQLFAADLRGKEITIPEEIRDYGRELLIGILEKKNRIDELIRSYSQGWDIDRLPAVDRNILRIAIYELLWSKEVPEAVAIDEALSAHPPVTCNMWDIVVLRVLLSQRANHHTERWIGVHLGDCVCYGLRSDEFVLWIL
mgnify:CR=1 FL=1